MEQLLALLLSLACPATLAEREGYTVCYDTPHQRAIWTAHTPVPSNTPAPRTHWRKDHDLNSLPAKAFANTGFDRGHLTPVADVPGSADIFLTSNAVAQDPKLNRGEWRALENQIRQRNATHVFTGAIYADCGNEKIEAPCILYKIALLPDGQIVAHFAINALPNRNRSRP